MDDPKENFDFQSELKSVANFIEGLYPKYEMSEELKTDLILAIQSLRALEDLAKALYRPESI